MQKISMFSIHYASLKLVEIKLILFILLFSLLYFPLSSALGVMYWHNSQVNFQPGLTLQLNYAIHGVDPNQDIRVYAEGDLAQYVDISPEKLTGGGGFTAILRLPDVIEKPGPHTIYFVAAEFFGEGGGIGTSVTIRVPYTVFVPYPGRYVGANLRVSDINVGEPLPVSLEGTNLGTENYTISANIEIYAKERVGIFDLGSIYAASQDTFVFKKKIDTKEYKPGNYKIIGIIDYGTPLRLEADFRIGSLFVSIINSSSRFMKNTINPFDVEVESNWNNPIDSVYAEVRVYNATRNVSLFKTPSENLERWGRKSLKGFFDTRGIAPGFYDAEIILFYSSGKRSAQTSQSLQIMILDDRWSTYQTYLIIGSAVLLLILIVFVALIFRVIFKKKKRGR